MENLGSILISALFSGLLATIVTLCWQRKSKIYDSKLRIFETLMAYRYNIVCEDNVKVLNTIDVIFHADKGVREAYTNFWNETLKTKEVNPQPADKYLKLLEEIAAALRLKNVKWDSIKCYYYPLSLQEKIESEFLFLQVAIEKALNESQNK